MYPIIVLLVVYQDRSQQSTSVLSTVVNVSRDQRSHMESMSFVPGPTHSSLSQTTRDKTVTVPQRASVHPEFGSMVELELGWQDKRAIA
jgi:hypothetical protein